MMPGETLKLKRDDGCHGCSSIVQDCYSCPVPHLLPHEVECYLLKVHKELCWKFCSGILVIF